MKKQAGTSSATTHYLLSYLTEHELSNRLKTALLARARIQQLTDYTNLNMFVFWKALLDIKIHETGDYL